MRTGIFFGSMTGQTERIAYKIGELLGSEIPVYDIGNTTLDHFLSFDFLILGTSTWDIGQLPGDWALFSGNFQPSILKGKFISLFGLGDQGSYPDSFADGLGKLANLVEKAGGKLLFPWKNEGYFFEHSEALKDGLFAGLVIDEECQPDLTGNRLNQWTIQLKMIIRKNNDGVYV